MSSGGVWAKFAQVVLRRAPIVQTNDGRKIPLRPNYQREAVLVDERRGAPYISNAIRTSTYTIWDFLPRQLAYQFSRLANSYLLVISILQAIPGLSTTGSFTTLIPLVIFVAIVIAKEGYYDWKRYRQDVAENNRPATVLRARSVAAYGTHDAADVEWMSTKWSDLKVGEVVKLSNNDDVPADMVLLHATGEKGFAFVETMALDGETNLKAKQRPATLADCSTIQNIAACDATFGIEDPNADLYRFDSKLTTDGKTLPLTINEVIYRGSTIRNTPEAVGIIVNTGEECKLRINSKMKIKAKKPRLEHITNLIILSLILFIFLLSGICTLCYVLWKDQTESRAWYLFDSTVPMVQIFIGFIIMFNNVIPLSLYVGLEGIKLGQLAHISSDIQMYDEATDTPARVNNTNNLDDLGQIGYLFTDKTGTLTENIMKVRKFSIAGTSWLHKPLFADDDPSEMPGSTSQELPISSLLKQIHSQPCNAIESPIRQFLLSMALCHTCLPTTGPNGEIEFQASSPDELALLESARELGFLVTSRSSQSITIQITHANGSVEHVEFQILDTIEFSSKRKRMSVIVRCPDGTLWLVCKGADSIILPRLTMVPTDMMDDMEANSGLKNTGALASPLHSPWHHGPPDNGEAEWVESQGGTLEDYAYSGHAENHPLQGEGMIPLNQNTRYVTDVGSFAGGSLRNVVGSAAAFAVDERECIRECFSHIDKYAAEGLRTLVYASKVLSEEEYHEWKRQYREAETSLHNRQERIEEVGELMEQDLHIVGATAVEDKLQTGVPETIEKLRQANVKIWMLTGDKRETAISIAYSARICGPKTQLFILDATSGNLEVQMTSISEQIIHNRNPAIPTAVVIDGGTLTAVEEDPEGRLRGIFYRLAPRIDSVICCRASPAQKAFLVRLIGNNPMAKLDKSRWSWLRPWSRPAKPLTLAIGDGANDVAMILTASVGVGITGREGTQATRVADFSISQFRFLARLMLVHGRWNYHRTTRFILTTFWKEVLFYFPQAVFQQAAGATGTSVYHSQALMFTSYLTAATILIVGMYEQDLKADTLLAVPELYAYGQNGEGLTLLSYLGWMSNSLIAAFIIFAGCWAGYAGSVEAVFDNGTYATGTLIFAVCMIWTNYKILIINTHHKTKLVLWSCFGSILGVFLYLLVTSVISGYDISPYSIKGGLTKSFGPDPSWSFTLISVVAFLIAIESVLAALRQNALVRAMFSRCLSMITRNPSPDGVREGFSDWEPCLWQEMEKDKAVQRVLENLRKTN